MHRLSEMIKEDMKPALGVTEPGAIAYIAAKARSYTTGEIEYVKLVMNSGMYKNAFTCGIPNSNEVGHVFAAALGVIAGDSEKELESLAEITPEDEVKAKELIREGKVTVQLESIDSHIFMEASVKTPSDLAIVTIKDSHTNISRIMVNNKIIFETHNSCNNGGINTDSVPQIHQYTLEELYEFAASVDIDELEFIKAAYEMNYALFEEGLTSVRTTFSPILLKKNQGKIISENEQATASLLCNTAIEARVIGLNKPAMSITGSGAHGIIATLPLYAACKVNGYSEEKLLRATALSYLVCMYIKEYSGKLSAFCGCAIAAGTGMACGLVLLREKSLEVMGHTILNMASSITGMICDGGNQGCTMKGIAAVDAAYQSVEFAINGAYIDSLHGINGDTPEMTMKNMGMIASPGMVETEKIIVEIMESKLK